MKLFITGGSGFIGSHLIQTCLARGIPVTALRRSSQRQPKIRLLQQPRWINKDLSLVNSADLEGCDAIIHLAAHSANPPYDSLERCLHWNLSVPLKLFNIAKQAGIHRILAVGSCFEYGLSGSAYTFIPVDAPLQPTLSYPASKAAASICFQQWAMETRSTVSIQRIFHVYGQGELTSRLWPSLHEAARRGADFPMTKGEQIRDFLEVGEAADQLLAAIERMYANTQPFFECANIGKGEATTVRDFASYWWQAWGARGRLGIGELDYRPGEIMRYVPLVHRKVIAL